MNLWTLMGPHAAVDLLLSNDEAAARVSERLALLPGVRRKGASWLVPMNALAVFGQQAGALGASIRRADWILPPEPARTWAEVDTFLREQGVLQEWVMDGFMTQYQKDAVAFGWNKSGVHYWHSTGAGKTLTGITASLSVEGPVVVVTRAVSRIQYAREIERFCRTKAFIVRPAAQAGPAKVRGETYNMFRARRKGQGLSPSLMAAAWEAYKLEHGLDAPPSISAYLAECAQKRLRPFIVVGWEALSDNLSDLRAAVPACVIFDEAHKGKSTKRFAVQHLPELPSDPMEAAKESRRQEAELKAKGGFLKDTEDGRKGFLPLDNLATCAAELARAARKRICTTATPIKDRTRDLWAQLDLAEPNCWGSSTSFRTRYCDMKPGVYGGMDDRGDSNTDELNARKEWNVHRLSYHDTHRNLPPKRRQSMYVAPEDQVSENGSFVRELRQAQARGASAVLEVKLAIAASRKRKAVLSGIEDHLASGQKVVVFTARRKDCEEMGELVKAATKKLKVVPEVWASHGGHPTDVRQGIVDSYMAHPGPCILVGTGDAFGEALNLDTTDAAFFVMLPYTPGQLRQWEGRFHRASTKKPVIIYYAIAEGTVDEHVASIIIDKLPAVEKISQDHELAAAKSALAGYQDQTDDEFASSVLSLLD